MAKSPFPKGFLWGVSIAAHQTEGHTHNQWSAWEETNAPRLAATAEQRLGHLHNWPHIAAQAKDETNYRSGAAADHYHRYKEDFALAKQLHMNTFRFSIEWSRIEPKEGEWDQAAIRHYREYMLELRRQGLEPLPTLWHWTVPMWFARRGGFEKRRNVRYFERFVRKVAEEYAGLFGHVLILNEPMPYAAVGYVVGFWPPGRRSLRLGIRVYRNLAYTYNRSAKILHAKIPGVQLGMAAHIIDFRPVRNNPINRLTVGFAGWLLNRWFLNTTRRQQDFLGVNYYLTMYLDECLIPRNPAGPLSDLGWYMEPSRLGAVLDTLWHQYHLPMFVTEDGVADAGDMHRQWWLTETIQALEQAVKRGIPIKGYLHWTLVDNYEWAFGWWPKFGLFELNRATMERTMRDSARWLADYIYQHRSLSDDTELVMEREPEPTLSYGADALGDALPEVPSSII